MTEAEKVPTRTLAELEPLIREAFADGKLFQLPVTGTSNRPTLRAGRDQVVLDRVAGPLKKYDLPLYRRDNGQYVLHRIIAVGRDGIYTCCGDGQWTPETGLRQDQLVAVAVGILRNGRAISVKQPGHWLWVRLWAILRPLRRYLLWLGRALSRCFRRLFSKH